jgi:hypothetical protein
LARLLRFDDGRGIGVDDVDNLPEPARLADIEELGEPPDPCGWRQRPPERDLEGRIERRE